jgi:hypothetical protein
LAIEPVEGVVAGEERFKCIQSINYGYHVITANSAGVVSVMNLQGAINMMMNDDNDPSENDSDANSLEGRQNSDNSDDESEELDLAVDIIASVQLGSGARVTCLAAWASPLELEEEIDEEDVTDTEEPLERDLVGDKRSLKRKGPATTEVEMDSVAVEKARALVNQAKKLEKKRAKKKRIKADAD